MILPRAFVDMLDITGRSLGDVLSIIAAKREHHIATATDVLTGQPLDAHHLFRFKSNGKSNSAACAMLTRRELKEPVFEDMPTFGGHHDGTEMGVVFIDFGDVRYITKGGRVEIVLLRKTLPLTLIQSIRQAPLHEVLTHPMMRPGRSIVATARQSGNSIALDCSNDLVEVDPEGRIVREIED